MSDNTNIDSTIEQALRNAREGAEEAGYGLRGAQYANLNRTATSATTSATSTVPSATTDTLGTPTPGNRHKVPSDRLGVSLTLSGYWVMLTYPPEMKHYAFIPMGWLTGEGNERTAKIISLHCDPLWLAEVVG